MYGPQILIFFWPLGEREEGKGIRSGAAPRHPLQTWTDFFFLQLCGPREVFFFFFVFFVFVEVDIIPFISTHPPKPNPTKKNQNHQFQCVLFSDNIGMRYGFGVVAHLGIFLISKQHNTPTTHRKRLILKRKHTAIQSTNQPTDLGLFFFHCFAKKEIKNKKKDKMLSPKWTTYFGVCIAAWIAGVQSHLLVSELQVSSVC